MNDNIVRTETLYTYEAAINQYERERHHTWLCNQRKLEAIRQEERDRRKYFCNQKFIGLIIIAIDLLLTLIIGNLVCIILALPGIVLMLTNKLAIVNDYWWTHGGPEQWKWR